ncbi:MAG TPA: DUF998 domain-containing protein [Thermomicrobiales bacterium]|mgnify:CR=1 FL=1|nr:DUF998 domain-containing protein [Thermomicrobiales bacterium]
MVALIETARRAVERHPRLERTLLGCGVASSVLYVAVDAIAAWRYEGYRYSEQQVSELLAEGAPTRDLMVALNLIPYNLLIAAFAAGIWTAAGQRSAGRMTAAMMAAYAVAGATGGGLFNMDRREIIAAGEDTLRNSLHGPATMVMSLFIVLGMASGSRLLGKRFQYYSYGTIATLVLFGVLTSLQIPQMVADEPTPWMGIEERVNIYATMLWIAALAIGLLRAEGATVPRPLGLPASAPRPMQHVPR